MPGIARGWASVAGRSLAKVCAPQPFRTACRSHALVDGVCDPHDGLEGRPGVGRVENAAERLRRHARVHGDRAVLSPAGPDGGPETLTPTHGAKLASVWPQSHVHSLTSASTVPREFRSSEDIRAATCCRHRDLTHFRVLTCGDAALLDLATPARSGRTRLSNARH